MCADALVQSPEQWRQMVDHPEVDALVDGSEGFVTNYGLALKVLPENKNTNTVSNGKFTGKNFFVK